MKETVTAKAKRLLRERHQRIRIYESSDDAITGMVEGDSGLYQVTIVRHGPDNVTYSCDCPASATCSHLLALEGYRMVRAGLARWEDLTG